MSREQRERASRPTILSLFALVALLAPRLHAGIFDPSARPSSLSSVPPTLSREAVEVLREIPEASLFELFTGDELARALYERALDTNDVDTSQAKSSVFTLELAPFESAPHRFTLDLASWAPTPLLANPPPGDELSYPKTRIGAFELSAPFRDGVERKLSLRTHWGCGLWSCENAEGGN